MEQLSDELLLCIFQFLSVYDTSNVAVVCARWNGVWSDDALWKVFHGRFVGGAPQPPLRPGQWRQSYRLLCLSLGRHSPSNKLSLAINHGADALVKRLYLTQPYDPVEHLNCACRAGIALTHPLLPPPPFSPPKLPSLPLQFPYCISFARRSECGKDDAGRVPNRYCKPELANSVSSALGLHQERKC